MENAQHYHDLRKKTEFKRNKVKTVYNGTETLTFLGPRIWEIRNKTMESRKLSMQVMQKVLTRSWLFIACLLIFMQHILSYISHIFILSILNRFVFYCNFFNPVGKNHVYLQEFVLG